MEIGIFKYYFKIKIDEYLLKPKKGEASFIKTFFWGKNVPIILSQIVEVANRDFCRLNKTIHTFILECQQQMTNSYIPPVAWLPLFLVLYEH